MSTSLLYHAFGVRGYQYIRTVYEAGRVRFAIRQPRKALRCSACGSRSLRPRGAVERLFRALPIGGRPVTIDFAVPRVGCSDCGAIRQVAVGFAEPRRSYTKAFERYALDLSRHMTIRAVAEHLGVSWDVIKDIQRRDLQRRFARPKLGHLRRIAIDEIAVGKRRRFLTVVLDLGSGAVVFVGEGKGSDPLEPFWWRLRRTKAKVEAVAIDMSPAYRRAVAEHLPGATVVFDRFHVVKLFNERLSDLRPSLHRQATAEKKAVLKGSRWLLLKNPENLDAQRDEAARLAEALRLNRPLAVAYFLKEDLRRFWGQPGKAMADRFLEGWIGRARASGVAMLGKMADTLEGHRDGLLAYYDHRISTGQLEGTNNKIKTLSRQAYGFRDREFFKLKLLAIHEARYALVG
ncbi:ISL3 family transposase [Tautonia plasticadhaerens]|uniref:Transposase n=1 Tax=Tautonia plasticadhaerens TaxID=2527974 RepID=A0A518H9B0_9BACT|nr:ISL3 family transposase [Tautonia plasticadhaerens]QDV37440.1 Transposase [Tautonia plasticadhaerens]